MACPYICLCASQGIGQKPVSNEQDMQDDKRSKHQQTHHTPSSGDTNIQADTPEGKLQLIVCLTGAGGRKGAVNRQKQPFTDKRN